MNFAKKDIVLVFAMEQESQHLFEDFAVLYTGIGKVNATYALTRYLETNRPGLVVNMGTAGSQNHPGGAVVNPASFVQRDMDVTPLGFAKYQTPFSDDPVVLEYGERAATLPGGVCGSGDNFDVSGLSADFDAVDMEAYALALVCSRAGVPFMCLKYISDGADAGAHHDWSAALLHAAQALRAGLEQALIVH